MCNICVYITNPMRFRKNGKLLGEWLPLPATEDKINEIFAIIGSPDEYGDYFINAAETENYDIDISPTTDLHELNELAKKIDALQGEDGYKLAAYLEWVPHLSLEEISKAIDDLDSYDFIAEVCDYEDFVAFCIRIFGSYRDCPKNLRNFVELQKYTYLNPSNQDIFFSSLGLIMRNR